MKSRSLIAALGLLCAASLPAQAAFAQNAGDPPTIAEMKAQDAAAMAASESRVKAFFAAQDVRDMMAAADGGDWIEQVRLADLVKEKLATEVWFKPRFIPFIIKYYGMAMEKNHGPAFARVGALAESVEYGLRDLSEAINYYEQGAKQRDRDAVAGYIRLALKPSFCSVCKDTAELEFKDEFRFEKLAGAKETYRTEKQAMAEKAMIYYAAGKVEAGDAAYHYLAAELMNGVEIPRAGKKLVNGLEGKEGLSLTEMAEITRQNDLANNPPQWLLAPNLDKAMLLLGELSGKGDNLASRKLASIYLTGRQGSNGTIAKDPRFYIHYMKQAADNGSIIAKYQLGYELLFGVSIPGNKTAGFDLIAEAAIAGYPPALVQSAYSAYNGDGTAKDPGLALDLFSRAGDLGELDGAKRAAMMYREGLGTPDGKPNLTQAAVYDAKVKQIESLSPAMATLLAQQRTAKFQ